jgi:hypothetical protein
VLAVYRGTSFGTLTRVVSDDESGGFHTSRVLFNVQKGVEYQFVVDSYAKKLGGLFTFSWHFVPSLCPLPENILPPVSQALKPGGNLELCATWTHPGNCALGLQWHLDGEPVPGATNACLVLSNVSAEAVGQYTLRVASADWTYWTVPAEVQLNTEGSSALARNRLEDARGSALVGVIEEGFKAGKSMKSGAPLASGYSGSQVFKTYPGKDPAEPDACGVAGGASYWFEYTPPEEGTLFLNTDGSTFDTVLAIYTDNGLNLGYASLVELACDNNSGTNGRTSALQVPVKRGTNYFIMVDGVNGASGRVSLNYRLDTPPKLSTIPTQSVKQNEATGWIPFTVGDSDLASVVFTGSSPVPDWVDAACFEFGGSGSNRTVRVTPRPERFGTNHVKITATDRIGGTRSTEFTLRVARQVSPLVVGSRLPAAGQGEAYRAVVPASGGVPPYSFTLLAGPAGFTLAADGVLTGQGSAGSYELQVRVADSEGRTTNAVVALAVVPPVRLHPTRSGDGLVFAFTGKPEKGYVLETTGDLAAGIWTALATNRAADGVISFSAVPPTGAAGFFRVREVP